MKFEKTTLGTMERVYATSIINFDDVPHFLVATEGKGPCLSFETRDMQMSKVWEEPGGSMNIIPLPGKKNEFLATQKFFPTFQAEESIIVHVQYSKDQKWIVTPIMKIPYLHRFDLFKIEDKTFFIGATLCDGKEFKDDWSKPGKVYIGMMNEDSKIPFKIQPILEGITKNHGFCNGEWEGKDSFLVSGSEGVFVLNIPSSLNQNWKIKKILDYEVSDIAVCDIDGDGNQELATIEGFHGDKGKIYKLDGSSLKVIHEHDYEFGHVVWGGLISSKPSFIIGGRKGNKELVCFQYKNGKIEEFLIDNKGGPSNISVMNMPDKDIILAANREVGEIAYYTVK